MHFADIIYKLVEDVQICEPCMEQCRETTEQKPNQNIKTHESQTSMMILTEDEAAGIAFN